MFQQDLYATYHPYIKDDIFYLPFSGHGIMHTRRVLRLALAIADAYDLSADEAKLLALSCCYHDIGRDNDCVDDEHGAKSAAKFLRLKLNEKHELNTNEVGIVLNLITMHSLNDNLFVGEERETLLFQILKDADALDRIRFGGLDIKYLRLVKSRKLIQLAQELYYADTKN